VKFFRQRGLMLIFMYRKTEEKETVIFCDEGVALGVVE
jgi:hypothetical protein